MAKLRTKKKSDDPIELDSAPPPKRAGIPLPKGWKRAEDALDRIESVSTIFPDFNRATRVGGLPVNRMHTVHGQTHGGKTAFVIGLMKSFLDGGHAAGYVDAEHSTPQEFAEELLGELRQRENFFGSRPETYEDTMDAVGDFLKTMASERIHRPEMKSIVVIDSINKLTPKRELDNVLREGGKEVSKGHAGRYRAAVNKSWLDHLSPRLKAAGCAMVFIAQEREGQEDQPWAADGGVEIKGGQSLSFDSSLLIRISKAHPLRDPAAATKEWPKGVVIGFQHRIRIYKSKVSHMDGDRTDCVFHMSNGKQTPAGFDVQRDALHVAKQLGIVTVSGSAWLSYGKQRWQGEMRAAEWLAKHRGVTVELLAKIEAKLADERAATAAARKRAM
jgi:RecA/RadA recombinase